MKTRTILIIAVLTLALFTVDVLAASVELTSARVAFRQGEYTRAIDNLLKEIEKKPEVEAYYILAKSYAELRDYKSAGEYFVLAEKYMDTEKEVKKFGVDMDDDRRLYWYNGFKATQPVYNQAKGYLDDPESAPPGVTAESKFEEAASKFEDVDNIFPYHPRTNYMIGSCYEFIAGPVRYEHEDGSLIEYRKDEDGQDQTREIYDSEYDDLPLVKANEAFLIALEVKLDDMSGKDLDKEMDFEIYIRKTLGTSAKINDYGSVLRVLEDGTEKFPGNPIIFYYQAMVYETQGDIGKAAEAYAEVLNSEGGEDFSDAYNALGDIYLNEDFADRDPQKALEYLEKGLEIAPDNYNILVSLGKACREIGKTEDSDAYYAKGQTLYKIDKVAKMGVPQEQAIEEFGEPEENFLMTTEYQGQEIEVDVAKFTFEDVTFYVQIYDGLSMGWSMARPTGSGE